ncbi:MAG: carbon-nitrogen hydrolase family protein [Fuerstiella sp.]
MKIAAAQISSSIGHPSQNVSSHLKLVDLAAKHNAALVVFPELSLTGYEPSLATKFAVAKDDCVFDALQNSSDVNAVTIVAGAPLQCDGLPQIAAFIIAPCRPIRVYSKYYLHSDEEPYFSPGCCSDSLISTDPGVSLAICYELSVQQHAQAAIDAGASVYAASVWKTTSGIRTASERLSWIARNDSVNVLMANGASRKGTAECAGGSAAWSRNGDLIASLDSTSEAVLVMDSVSEDFVIAAVS